MLGFFVGEYCLRQILFFDTDKTDVTDKRQESKIDLHRFYCLRQSSFLPRISRIFADEENECCWVIWGKSYIW